MSFKTVRNYEKAFRIVDAAFSTLTLLINNVATVNEPSPSENLALLLSQAKCKSVDQSAA
jgi:hypothetical protein